MTISDSSSKVPDPTTLALAFHDRFQEVLFHLSVLSELPELSDPFRKFLKVQEETLLTYSGGDSSSKKAQLDRTSRDFLNVLRNSKLSGSEEGAVRKLLALMDPS